MADLAALVRTHWPEHAQCVEQREPLEDPQRGIVCDACGAILGFPVEEPPGDVEPPSPIQRVLAKVDSLQAARGCPWTAQGAVCAAPAERDHYGACSAEHARLYARYVLRTAAPTDPRHDVAAECVRNGGVRPPLVVDAELPEPVVPEPVVPEHATETFVPEADDPESRPQRPEEGDAPQEPTGASDDAQADWMSDPEVQAAALQGYREGGGLAYAAGYAAGERALTEGEPPWAPEETEGRGPDAWESVPGVPDRAESGVVPRDPLDSQIVVIDSSAPYTPADVEAQLVEVAAKLERGVHYQRYWEERAYRAGMALEMQWSRAIVKHRSSGAADVRKALATIDCELEIAEDRLCQTMIRAMRETMHNLRSLQTGYQTISNSVRSSFHNQR